MTISRIARSLPRQLESRQALLAADGAQDRLEPPQGEGLAQASRHHPTRAPALFGVRYLLSEDGGEPCFRHARPAQHTRALERARRAHHDHAVTPPLASRLE